MICIGLYSAVIHDFYRRSVMPLDRVGVNRNRSQCRICPSFVISICGNNEKYVNVVVTCMVVVKCTQLPWLMVNQPHQL